MSDRFLVTERQGGVMVLTMNEPRTRNALSGNFAVDEFVRVCGEIAGDTSVRAVVITGAGPAFSAGGYLDAMRADWRPAIPVSVV